MALVQRRDARVDIAAKKLDPQVRATLQQNGLAAHRGGADNSAPGKVIKAGMATDQRITPVLARQHRGNHRARGEHGLHILHRMYGSVAITVEKTAFQFLDEQALAAGIGKRPVENTVATRCHGPDFGGKRGQPVPYDLGLRNGQRRGAARQNQWMCGTDVGVICHSGQF